MTIDKRPSRNQPDDDARLLELKQHGAALLSEFEDNFKMPFRLTLVARNPERAGGGLDIVITDDDGRAIAETVLRRMPGTAGSDERTGLFLADRLIAISAFRYALGRMTYVPSHVVDWLLANRSKLSKPDRELIVREIDEAAELRRLALDCDVATWTRLRKALESTPVEDSLDASRSTVNAFGQSVDAAKAEERRRACLDAVLQQTQSAGPSATHVTLPIASDRTCVSAPLHDALKELFQPPVTRHAIETGSDWTSVNVSTLAKLRAAWLAAGGAE